MKFVGKILQEKEKKMAFLQRHKIFTEELGWTQSEVEEYDTFDQNATFLGIVTEKEKKLVCHCRIIFFDKPWMFDDPFKNTLSQELKKEPGSCEITRYFVPLAYRKTRVKISGLGEHFLSYFMIKLLFHFNLKHKLYLNYFYALREHIRLFKMQGYPIEVFDSFSSNLGHGVGFPCKIDWRKSSYLMEKNPNLFTWMIK